MSKRDTKPGIEAGRKRIKASEQISNDAEIAVASKYECLQRQIEAALPEIVNGLIQKAKGGAYQQAKLLLDLYRFSTLGIAEATDQSKQNLYDVLLEGLQFIAPEFDAPESEAGIS